jgi:pyruvate,orthophosphate dikinase
VKFCHKLGLSYVSCSPYRVPVARLAAAQAAIADTQKAAKGKTKSNGKVTARLVKPVKKLLAKRR